MKCFWLILSILLLIGIVGGCGGKKGQQIRLYTSMPSGIIESIQVKFNIAHPEVELEVIAESTTALRSRIDLEAESPQGLQADLIWAADPSEYIRLIEKGFLLPYDSQEGTNIPDQFKNADNYYYAGRLMSMGMAYNTNQLTPEEVPKRWIDLEEPRWKDKIVLADPRRSGAALAWLSAITKDRGWDFIEALGANNITIEAKNGVVAKKIEQGDYQIGIVLDYIARGKTIAGSPIEVVYPEDGVVMIPSPIAIIKGSKNVEDAQTFIDFVLSKEGQMVLVNEGSFIPTRPDVSPPKGLDQATVNRAINSSINIDWAEVSSNRIKTIRQFKNIILD